MTHMNRRHFGAGMFAMGASLVMPVSTASAANMRIPTAPMRLSRMIERQLFDGKRITVARDWIIRFADSGRGIRIDGFQQQVSVDAPEKLERLAQVGAVPAAPMAAFRSCSTTPGRSSVVVASLHRPISMPHCAKPRR